MGINSNIRDQVQIDGKTIDDVHRYIYVYWWLVTSKGGSDEDISNILFKAKAQFVRLKKFGVHQTFPFEPKSKYSTAW